MSRNHKHHDLRDATDEATVRRVLASRSSDMNVTPLIDVLLVLLVIFISALPLTQRGLDIELPPDSQSPPTTTETQQVVIQRSADGVVTVNKQVVQLADLQERLRGIYAGRKDKTIFIIGADSLHYGDVVPLLDAATGLGLRIGIITPGLQASAQRPK